MTVKILLSVNSVAKPTISLVATAEKKMKLPAEISVVATLCPITARGVQAMISLFLVNMDAEDSLRGLFHEGRTEEIEALSWSGLFQETRRRLFVIVRLELLTLRLLKEVFVVCAVMASSATASSMAPVA